MSAPNKPAVPPDPATEKVVADEVSFRARALELDMRERVDQNTRERLDATANFVGIVAAVVFGVFGLGTYLLVQSLVGTEVRTQISERVGGIEREVERTIEDQGREISGAVEAEIEAMRAQFEATVEDLEATVAALEAERSMATLLPLVVGEAIDIDDDPSPIPGSPPTYSEQLVIEAMAQIAPSVEALDGFAFNLAVRRIERILDIFWQRGRYFEMHAVLNAMSPELQSRLFGHPTQGILYTVADGLAAETLQEGALPASRQDVLHRISIQPVRPEEPAAIPMAYLATMVTAQELGWGAEEVVTQLQLHADRWPSFRTSFLYNQVCYIEYDLPDNRDSFTQLQADVHERLSALSAAFSSLPIERVCARFDYSED